MERIGTRLAASLALALGTLGSVSAAQRAALVEPRTSWTRYVPGNTGIQGDYVQTILIDGEDQPWIAGYTPFWEHGGVSHWNGDHWENLSNVDLPAIASPRFNDMLEDPSGVIWIASDAGLLRYDPALGPRSLTRFDESNTPMPSSQLRDLALAPDGALWIAIHDVNSAPSGGLARFHPVTGAWNVWTTANGLPWGQAFPGWDWVDRVEVVPDPNVGFVIWFQNGSLGMGERRGGTFSWFGQPGSVPASAPVTPMGLPSARAKDAQGNVWVQTNRGLARRAPNGTFLVTGYPAIQNSVIACVFARSGGRAVLGTYYADVFEWDGSWTYLGNWGSGNHTYAFAEDSTGALWAGGIGGASKLENGAWQRYRITNTGMIGYFLRTLDFGAGGTVYVNGNAGPGVGGFNIFDGVHWIGVNDANYGLGPPWGLPSDDVEALRVRANGRLLLAPAGLQGMLEWDGAGYRYLVPKGYDIVEVEEDGLGRAWGAHNLNEGVSLVTQDGRVQFDASNSPLPDGSIGSVVADDDNPGFVWIGAQFGIAHTDGVTWEVYPRELLGLTLNSLGYHITCLEPDGAGALWVASGRGLFHFDPETLQYEQWTTANSLLPSDEINALELAPDGSIWSSTFDSTFPYPGGLTRFDGRTWTMYTTANSPLPHNQLSDLAARRTRDGYEMWVATASEGLAVISIETATPRPVRR
jgi:ligand-binding sensor domain-containing protein